MKGTVEVILACTKKFGIGLNGRLPWSCSEELAIFKEKTRGHVLIIGRKTAQNLPKLTDRTILCVSRSKNNTTTFTTIKNAILFANENYPNKKVFIAGGAQIYDYVFEKMADNIAKIHISFMDSCDTICDTFVNISFANWVITEKDERSRFTHYVMEYDLGGEKQYNDILSKILHTGKTRKGRNGNTRSLFNEHLRFDLTDGFPLLTTKRMFFRGIVEELLFFLRGETDSTLLEKKRVKIWTCNTNREFLDTHGFKGRKTGMMGPMYGYQWRYFNAVYNEQTGKPTGSGGIDQLANVVKLIREDPHSRRILMTDYNPEQASQGVLYPCHSIIIQFYVDDGYLDMFCYNRSQDLFLGTPFNIASSALLLTLVASMTDLKPRILNMTLGDAHIYEEHFDAVIQQLGRTRYQFPKLVVLQNAPKDVKDIDALAFSDFVLDGYEHHPPIKAKMVA